METGMKPAVHTGALVQAQPKSEAGFTLLELMISVAVLAIAAVSIGLVLHASDRTDRHAQNWTVANRAAQKALEQYLSVDYQDVIDVEGLVQEFGVNTTPPVEGQFLAEDIGAAWGGPNDSAYRLTATVQDDDLQLNVVLSTVRVRY